MAENKANYSTEYLKNGNGRQRIVVTDSSLPDYMLTFNEIVYKGYNTEDERNKKESISIHSYPLCLYIAYKQILRHTDNPRLQYISDIQRYSTILGHAIIENASWYKELEELYYIACDSENLYLQELLDSTKQYGFRSIPMRYARRGIKTVCYISESLEIKSNIFGIKSSSLIVLCSLMGLRTAQLPKQTKDQVILECDSFKDFVEHQKEQLKI